MELAKAKIIKIATIEEIGHASQKRKVKDLLNLNYSALTYKNKAVTAFSLNGS